MKIKNKNNILIPREYTVLYKKHGFKYCRICDNIKTYDEFSKNKSNTIGVSAYCSICMSKISKEYRINNPDSVKKSKQKYNKKSYNKKYHAEYRKKWLSKNKKRHEAHKIITALLRCGKIITHPCLKCGNEKVDAHHNDYSKPLEIIWLCRRHHKLIH